MDIVAGMQLPIHWTLTRLCI